MSASDIDAVRDWVGESEPDDPSIADQLARWPTDPLAVDRAALAILQRRLVDLLASPDQWAVANDYSESYAATIAPLERAIARLRALTGQDAAVNVAALPAVTAARIMRPDPSRFRFGRR